MKNDFNFITKLMKYVERNFYNKNFTIRKQGKYIYIKNFSL